MSSDRDAVDERRLRYGAATRAASVGGRLASFKLPLTDRVRCAIEDEPLVERCPSGFDDPLTGSAVRSGVNVATAEANSAALKARNTASVRRTRRATRRFRSRRPPQHHRTDGQNRRSATDPPWRRAESRRSVSSERPARAQPRPGHDVSRDVASRARCSAAAVSLLKALPRTQTARARRCRVRSPAHRRSNVCRSRAPAGKYPSRTA